ncbi:MAG: hypothetical protein IJT25_02765, partial [Clostridia bacterium]|nr:hypothetical protein [Clostridia bacterium]
MAFAERMQEIKSPGQTDERQFIDRLNTFEFNAEDYSSPEQTEEEQTEFNNSGTNENNSSELTNGDEAGKENNNDAEVLNVDSAYDQAIENASSLDPFFAGINNTRTQELENNNEDVNEDENVSTEEEPEPELEELQSEQNQEDSVESVEEGPELDEQTGEELDEELEDETETENLASEEELEQDKLDNAENAQQENNINYAGEVPYPYAMQPYQAPYMFSPYSPYIQPQFANSNEPIATNSRSSAGDLEQQRFNNMTNQELSRYVSFVKDNAKTSQTGVVSGYYEATNGTRVEDAIRATISSLNRSNANEATLKDISGIDLNISRFNSADEVFGAYEKLRRENVPIATRTNNNNQSESEKVEQKEDVNLPSTTQRNKTKVEEQRQENRNAFKVGRKNVSKDEAIEIMNSTMEEDYNGKFKEINASDFEAIEKDVSIEYEAIKNINPATTNEEDYLEQLYRASYDKAVCDYYGRFVPRKYASNNENNAERILSSMDAKIAHEKDVTKFSYDELIQKKSELTYKRKAYEALYQLGAFNELEKEKLAVISEKIEDAREKTAQVEDELVSRRASTKEAVASKIENIINNKQFAKIEAEDLKRAKVSVKETIKTTTNELSKEKKNTPKAPKKKAPEEEKLAYKDAMATYNAKCEAMQAEIDRNEEISILFDAYNFYKSNNYKTESQISESLDSASLSDSTLLILEAMFKGSDGKNTPKSKLVRSFLSDPKLEAVKSVNIAKLNEIRQEDLKEQKKSPAKKLDSKKEEDNKQEQNAKKEESQQKPNEKEIINNNLSFEDNEPAKVKTSKKGDARVLVEDGKKKTPKTRKNKQVLVDEGLIEKADDATKDAEALLGQLEKAQKEAETLAQQKNSATLNPESVENEKEEVASKHNAVDTKKTLSPKETNEEPLRKVKKASVEASKEAKEKLIKEEQSDKLKEKNSVDMAVKEEPKSTAVIPYENQPTAVVLYKNKPTAESISKKKSTAVVPYNPRAISLQPLDEEDDLSK